MRVSAVVVIVVLGGVLVAAERTGAHFQTYPYTLSGCPAAPERQVDPVNVVFWDGATVERSVDSIETHAGWRGDGGSRQFFSDHGICRAQDDQRASGCDVCSRFHVRVAEIADLDPDWGRTARGDAHHEDTIVYRGCHAVDANGPDGSGFDQGRRRLRELLSEGGHGWRSQFWGNTRNFRQCDGDYAGSDGYVVFVRVDYGHHDAP